MRPRRSLHGDVVAAAEAKAGCPGLYMKGSTSLATETILYLLCAFSVVNN